MTSLRQIDIEIPADPKKSIPLSGVSGGTQVFAKQLNIHIFGFPTKYLTNTFKCFIVRKKIFVIAQSEIVKIFIGNPKKIIFSCFANTNVPPETPERGILFLATQ